MSSSIGILKKGQKEKKRKIGLQYRFKVCLRNGTKDEIQNTFYIRRINLGDPSKRQGGKHYFKVVLKIGEKRKRSPKILV